MRPRFPLPFSWASRAHLLLLLVCLLFSLLCLICFCLCFLFLLQVHPHTRLEVVKGAVSLRFARQKRAKAVGALAEALAKGERRAAQRTR